MKPIFEQERKNLNRYYPYEIVPENCWRDNNSIYLNFFDKQPLLTFKVDLKAIYSFIDIEPFKKDILLYRKRIKEEKNLTREEEYELLREDIERKEKESLIEAVKWIDRYHDTTYKTVVSVSGGKDSELTKHIIDKAYDLLDYEKDYRLLAFNSTNETPQTYKYLKNYYGLTKKDIISPEKGWHKFIQEDKDYFLPTTLCRYCCSTYKEGQMKKQYSSKENLLIILGMRKNESAKRSFYDFDLNKAWVDHYKDLPKTKKLNVPTNWKRFLPIVNFTDEEVWLYTIHNKLEINEMYKMGFSRVGCLICPESSRYSSYLVEKYYPTYWKRWVDMVYENYKRKNIKKQLKWDELEYIFDEHWKNFNSLESKILNRKINDDDIEYLAYIKGCSEEVAKNFYNKKCKCGKKLNPKEIAMHFKINGNTNDDCLCKKCLCKTLNMSEKEYTNLAITFMNQGCSLF